MSVIYKNTFPVPNVRFSKILRWKTGFGPKERTWPGLAVAAETGFPAPALDLKAICEPDGERIQVTWIGHSSFLIQYRGRNILTDPIFGDCLTPVPGLRLKRKSPPGLTMEQLPPIHDVLMSHNHYDHLDAPSVTRLAKLSDKTRFWLPSGLSAWFRRKKITNVRELAWWDSAEMGEGIELHCLPAQHFAARGPFDRNHTHWCGWLMRGGGRTIYYAGDSGYSEEFKEIGRRFGPMDVSLIPIGAYNPRWVMQPVHADPFEAVKIHQDVRSRFSIGCHWGTFELTDEPWGEPAALLKLALKEAGIPEKDFVTVVPGRSVVAE
ncbi:MAG TPA: MBL fold metallo-hydrolase [Verrucomicrobiae bacterium]|nr:MBL fold metallo-hydrolase [Verrucomicrobiae bacterium]